MFGRQPGQPRYSGQLHNMSITESVFGTVLAIVIGTQRVHGKLLDYNGFTVTQVSPGGGKGIFGGKGQIANYSANVAVALAQGPCVALLSVWDQQGKLANISTTGSYVVPSGGGTYTPAATLGTAPVAVDLGVTAAQAYSVTANDYGAGGSATYSGTQQVPQERTSGTPAAGQYGFNPTTGAYSFPASSAGQTMAISYSSVFSLYYFEETQAAEIPISGPYTISTDNQPYFQTDNGVTFVDTGAALTSVGGTPSSGQYNENVGFYTFAAADAGRYVYIKYTYYSSDPDLTTSSSLNLTFFNGAQGQSPWSFFSSNYPSSAFGYSGICYVGANPMAMGESPTLPSYNYELVGQCVVPGYLDADVTRAIALLLTNPLCGVNFPTAAIGNWTLAQSYLGANGAFISDTLTTQSSVGETIKTWLDALNVAPVWSGSVLKLIPYGDRTAVGNGYTYTPPGLAATLTWDDILPWTDKKTGEATDEDLIQVERAAPQDAYNYMQVEWTNRENDYNIELTPEQNDAFIRMYGLRMEGPQSWHFIPTQAVASWALNLRLKRALYKRNTYKFNLPFTFSRLEGMDIVMLPTGEPVRLTQVTDAPDGKLTMSAEQFSYGSGYASIYPKQPPSSYQPNNSQAVPGNTSAQIFEASPQSVLAQPNTVQIAVAGNQPAWGGCDIYVSLDGTTYTKINPTPVLSGNRTGLLSAALANTPDPDTTDTLSVDMTMSGGELVTATAAEADAFVTLCAIVDRAGTLELISYETATLTAANRYNLTTLRRGVYGTTIGAHAIGAEFSYIGTGGVYEYQYPAQYVGQTLFFKFPAFNLLQGQQQELSACKAYTFTISGTTLQPPSSGVYTISPANPFSAYTISSSVSYVDVNPFSVSFNGQTVQCLPAGPYDAGPALNPNQLYYVYYVDLAFQGGAITPIFTQNQADFLNKTGYYLIGQIMTPAYTGGGMVGPWYPTNYVDTGSSTTTNPTYPYSRNPSEYATILGSFFPAHTYPPPRGTTPAIEAIGVITYLEFPNTTPTGESLYVTFAFAVTGAGGSYQIQASFDSGSTWATVASGASAVSKTTVTYAVPSGTNLDAIQVKFTVTPVSTSTAATATMSLYDTHVQ